MAQFLVFMVIVFAPRFILFLAVPQALVRGVAVSMWLFGFPVAAVWFALKSQMIRPGGKLYRPESDSVRPTIERNIRIIVLAFSVFVVYVETLPLAHDLIALYDHRAPVRISKQVKSIDRGYRNMGIEETISFSDGGKSSYLWYPTTVLRSGSTYDFVVLPQSRMILDYHELTR